MSIDQMQLSGKDASHLLTETRCFQIVICCAFLINLLLNNVLMALFEDHFISLCGLFSTLFSFPLSVITRILPRVLETRQNCHKS